jgi:hypothetical protein
MAAFAFVAYPAETAIVAEAVRGASEVSVSTALEALARAYAL